MLGKGGKHRTVYCTGAAIAAVNDYLAARGPDLSPALFISVARADLVRGKALQHNRLTTDGARSALTALRRRLGADPALFALVADLRSPHAARHTAATTLLEATDGDVRLVQEVLGHATLETLRVYTEITDRRKRAAYQRLGKYLEEVTASGCPARERVPRSPHPSTRAARGRPAGTWSVRRWRRERARLRRATRSHRHRPRGCRR